MTYCYRLASVILHSLLTSTSPELPLFLEKSSSLLSGIDQTNQVKVYGSGDQGRIYQSCKFRDPWVEVFVLGPGYITCSYIEKMLKFFKILFLNAEHKSDKLSTQVYSSDKLRSTQIVSFMIFKVGVVVLSRHFGDITFLQKNLLLYIRA